MDKEIELALIKMHNKQLKENLVELVRQLDEAHDEIIRLGMAASRQSAMQGMSPKLGAVEAF